MKVVFTALTAGFLIGILATWFFTCCAVGEYRQEAARGVGIGFGAGFGAVLALMVWNWLVGYTDRVASGKASQP